MKNLIIIALFVLSLPSFAGFKKVLLITSLADHQVKLQRKVERKFIQNLPHRLEPVIVHQADQFILRQHLMSEEYLAIFWLSHGSFAKLSSRVSSSAEGIKISPKILDFQKNNVAPIFSQIHPGTKYLAVIGCNTKQIINFYRESSNWSHSDVRNTYIPQSRVPATWTLKRAMKDFNYYFYNFKLYPHKPFPVKKFGYLVLVKRTIPIGAKTNDVRPVRVEVAGSLIGVLPKQKPGTTLSKYMFLPKQENFNRSQLNVRFSTGHDIEANLDPKAFGSMEIVSQDSDINAKWEVFAKSDGTPFGIYSQNYLFKGSKAILETSIQFSLFK